MTAAPAPTRQRPATPTPATAPGRVLTALAVRQVRRGALVVTAVSAGMSALVVATFRSEALDPAALGALARNPAIRTLFGEPVALDDPGGFTVWRTGTVLSVLIGVWGMLAVTRITRGEEDAGRWSMLLSGRPTLTDAVRRHLDVVAVVPVIVGEDEDDVAAFGARNRTKFLLSSDALRCAQCGGESA